jgi:multiple sugar transport system ATP-binding protein
VTHDQIEAMTMADKIVVMNAGNVEQIGSPLELYDFPANQFVAGFIGSPAMNFLDGTLETNSHGRAVNVAPDCSVVVEPTSQPDGREVVLGVRPEHFIIHEPATHGTTGSVAGIEAEVIVTEPTGADTQVFCRVAGKEVVAISRQRHLFRPATRIRLEAQAGKTCLFDRETGQRL